MSGTTSDLTCDVAVIGGGVAGVSVAAELAADRRVVLLEGEPRLGYHATSRAAAVHLPSYGGPVARALTLASRPLFDRLAEAGRPRLLSPRPLLVVATDDGGERIVGDRVAADVGLEPTDHAETLRWCPALRPDVVRCGGLDVNGTEIDTAALLAAYTRRIRRHGGTVVTAAPVHRITRAATGWELAAGRHRVSAATIVNAAGAWADEVAALADVPPIGLQPKRRTAFISPVHGFPDRHRWPLVADGQDRWYFKPDPGGVLVSPSDEAPSPPCDARPDETEIARAIDAVDQATTLGLRSVAHAWAGLRSFVRDGEPVVGAYDAIPDFHFAAGQGGYGLQLAPALARLAASLLLTGTVPADLTAQGIHITDVSPQRLS
ncbi:MAG TPA: FAD-dependent oxidoreductase [Thermomonospora sp.]|nr:FAD-dependent oxidoreductase [Thermomonospora sp.]